MYASAGPLPPGFTCVRRVYSYRTGDVNINNPKPLSGNRRSLSESSGPSPYQPCRLLTQLPFEIRLQIWRYVLGDKVFHIELRPGRLMSWICSDCKERDGLCHALWHLEGSNKESYLKQESGVLALPQTCRQIYGETIEFLYSNNTFDISDLGVLKYFVQGVLSKRLCLIQNLRVHWQDWSWSPRWPAAHVGFAGTWEMFWTVVFDGLTGLKKIDILMCSAERENHMPEQAAQSLSSHGNLREWVFGWEPDGKHRCRLVQGRRKLVRD